MADEHLDPANLVGLTSAEMDELDRLRQTLGHETFNEVQRQTWKRVHRHT
jgi:hypothetical protein